MTEPDPLRSFLTAQRHETDQVGLWCLLRELTRRVLELEGEDNFPCTCSKELGLDPDCPRHMARP